MTAKNASVNRDQQALHATSPPRRRRASSSKPKRKARKAGVGRGKGPRPNRSNATYQLLSTSDKSGYMSAIVAAVVLAYDDDVSRARLCTLGRGLPLRPVKSRPCTPESCTCKLHYKALGVRLGTDKAHAKAAVAKERKRLRDEAAAVEAAAATLCQPPPAPNDEAARLLVDFSASGAAAAAASPKRRRARSPPQRRPLSGLALSSSRLIALGSYRRSSQCVLNCQISQALGLGRCRWAAAGL